MVINCVGRDGDEKHSSEWSGNWPDFHFTAVPIILLESLHKTAYSVGMFLSHNV